MEELSRRNLLRASGAAAAVGTVGMAAPTWAWSPAGSLAGANAGTAAQTDPKHVWDDEADTVVRALFERGEVARVNDLLKKWVKNSDPLPAGLPADLVAFLEKARKLPSWADEKKLADAVTFNTKRGLYLGVLYGFVSGMVSTVIPQEALAVYYSKGGYNLKDRISKTAKFGYDIGSLNAYKPGGEMIVTAVKTRLAHAGVRYLLPQSHTWTGRAPEDVPISQADLLVTWHSLPTLVMRMLNDWKVPIPAKESEGFLHSWQVSGYMLGLREEYIPKSWAAAEAQAKIVFDPILRPTPEGLKLADALLDLGKQIDGTLLTRGVLEALTRYMLGEQIASWLKLTRQPLWDTLLKVAWRPFVAVREGILPLPFMPAMAWAFDEILRQFVLLYMSEFRKIQIQIPVVNNPAHP
ncbi:oxygenase MpaB family protein [Nocardioides yefusunii]|uniref:Oxygenase MpaB family protein n=1 Tax=Nocardioides yefusunii TaxID=2500546 RepID=A0ABW1QWX1_9ACTN|nr:oxygenase MpaB family protein [Nocardioides yefusunii]